MKIHPPIKLSLYLLTIWVGQAFGSDQPKSHFFDSNGFRLHYLESGSGETIVLLHGFSGSSQTWVETGVFPGLAKDYHVIALDARGHGKSDQPHDVSVYGAETAEDIIRLLDHAGVEKAHIIASSFGVRIFGKVMAKYPERFSTAVLVGQIPVLKWTSEDQQSVEERAHTYRTQPPPYFIKRDLDAEALSCLALSFSELVGSEKEYQNLNIPTLSVFGSLEENYLSRYKTLEALMPDSELFVIEGARHGKTYPRPEFLTKVREFLAKH